MYCDKCGYQVSNKITFCPNCGAAVSESDVVATSAETAGNAKTPLAATKPAQPMKWYKFLIYFSLFASAAGNVLSGILYLSGTLYSPFTEQYYSTFGFLHAVDIIMGIVCFAMAIMCIYTRFLLARYRKSGPDMLMAIYAVRLLTEVVYTVVSAVIVAKLLGSFQFSFGSVLLSIIMIFANKVYFDKRADMFVN